MGLRNLKRFTHSVSGGTTTVGGVEFDYLAGVCFRIKVNAANGAL